LPPIPLDAFQIPGLEIYFGVANPIPVLLGRDVCLLGVLLGRFELVEHALRILVALRSGGCGVDSFLHSLDGLGDGLDSGFGE